MSARGGAGRHESPCTSHRTGLAPPVFTASKRLAPQVAENTFVVVPRQEGWRCSFPLSPVWFWGIRSAAESARDWPSARRLDMQKHPKKLKLRGFNNLTKSLSFNIYDICYAKSRADRKEYLAYLDMSHLDRKSVV